MLVTSIFSFPTMFSTPPFTNFSFWVVIHLLSANALNLKQSLVLLFGKELIEANFCGLFKGLTLSQTSPGFYVSAVQIFWKHCGKGEIAHNEQFLLFPQCFLPIWRTFSHFHQVKKCCLQTLSVWKGLKLVVWVRVNPFPHNDTFWHLWETSLLKTLWEKEKLLVTSHFSFSHSVFYPSG